MEKNEEWGHGNTVDIHRDQVMHYKIYFHAALVHLYKCIFLCHFYKRRKIHTSNENIVTRICYRKIFGGEEILPTQYIHKSIGVEKALLRRIGIDRTYFYIVRDYFQKS